MLNLSLKAARPIKKIFLSKFVDGDRRSKNKLRDILDILNQYRIGKLHQNIVTNESKSAWLYIDTG